MLNRVIQAPVTEKASACSESTIDSVAVLPLYISHNCLDYMLVQQFASVRYHSQTDYLSDSAYVFCDQRYKCIHLK